MGAAHFHRGLQELFLIQAEFTAYVAHAPRGGGADKFGENVLDADVFVAQTLGQFLGQGQAFAQTLRNADALPFHARTAHAGPLVQGLFQRVGHRRGPHPHTFHDTGHQAVFLPQQSEGHVLHVHFLMPARHGDILRVAQRFLGFYRQFVDVHRPLLGRLRAHAAEPRCARPSSFQARIVAVCIRTPHKLGYGYAPMGRLSGSYARDSVG